ncbi:MAG: DUF3598 family protein [Oscillatoriales cyanobacterium RM2_1_1]|nr:DUF3598 family protein [Oscillatoriales cyanobacterium SM2_3_0]NJO47806.1 DUF3598 family protein [Oscillatoriales cyanobacterium RM2_1_1]
MGTQWENFLKNLGEWRGSFTQISPVGEILKDTPSLLKLEGLEGNQTVRLTLQRFPSKPDTTTNPPDDPLVREYQSLGKDILFFESGTFSQGTIQVAPFAQSGGEFGFVHQDRRLRLVELFDPGGDLKNLTLIREYRGGTHPAENPALTVEQLLGTWRGEAVTLYPDLRSPQAFPTQMRLQRDGDGGIEQQLTFGDRRISSRAVVAGSVLRFDTGPDPVQVVLLPGGASATVPQQVKLRTAFFLEAGWLLNPQERQRLIRQYDDTGAWVGLTLVREYRVD